MLTAGDLDSIVYFEASQPPKGPGGKLSGVPNVVGGKAVHKPGCNTNSATKTTGAEPFAAVSGEAISAVAPSDKVGLICP